MKYPTIVFVFIISTAGAQAECIQVLKSDVSVGKEANFDAVTWKAEFQNECQAYVDITVNVELVDENEESIYSLSAVESFGFREGRKVEKQVYVPNHVAKQTVGIKIETEERQRP